MSGVWYRTLVYLGLKEEPEEGYDELPERVTPEDDPQVRRTDPSRVARFERSLADGSSPQEDDTVVRHLHPDEVRIRAVPAGGGASRVAVVELEAFDDVEAVAARYRTGQAVLFDVSGVDAAVGRRVVDFVSGVTYALRGQLSKVGDRAFLLVPDGVQVPENERRRLSGLGYRLPTGSDA